MNRTEMNVSTGELKTIAFTGAELDAWTAANAIAQADVFPNAKVAFILQIDTDADTLIRSVIGERASQYEGAEREALAYKAAGYTGTVPPKVQAWATAKNQTATWAADSQIAASVGWRNAENTLFAKRLLCKEQVRNVVDSAGLDDIKAHWSTFMVALKTNLI